MKLEKQLEVQAWLKKANDDLRCAQIDLEALPPIIEDALKKNNDLKFKCLPIRYTILARFIHEILEKTANSLNCLRLKDLLKKQTVFLHRLESLCHRVMGF